MAGLDGEQDDIFRNFHSNYGSADMTVLCSAYENLFDDSFLKAYSIEIANCTKPVSFKNAYIDLEWHSDEIYSLADIFAKGLNMLRSFLLSKEIPKPPYRKILSSLLTYLLNKDIMEELDSVIDHSKTEEDVTYMLLNHLFLRVTPPTECIIDRQSNWRDSCPDSCKHDPIDITEHDTSIGHHTVWHGSVDAMIGKPRKDAAVALTRVGDSAGSPGFRSGMEVKKSFTDADLPSFQIISQCIVFSFLQRKLHPENKNSLIPTVGISATELVVYFYDCTNDILLQSLKSFSFEKAGVKRIQAVIVAWLIVNYKYLSDGFVEILTTVPKANFHKVCKDSLHVYENQMKQGGVERCESKKAPWWEFVTATKKMSERTVGIKRIKLDMANTSSASSENS